MIKIMSIFVMLQMFAKHNVSACTTNEHPQEISSFPLKGDTFQRGTIVYLSAQLIGIYQSVTLGTRSAVLLSLSS